VKQTKGMLQKTTSPEEAKHLGNSKIFRNQGIFGHFCGISSMMASDDDGIS
jgi:hypothetical protein